MNSDNEDDIMDPVMQCTTLPSHSSFSQQKLVSFVTEIHTTSINFLTPMLEDLTLKSWKSYQGDSSKLNLPDHRYQVYQGRLLASFQDDAKYEHVGQDTRSQGDRGLKIGIRAGASDSYDQGLIVKNKGEPKNSVLHIYIQQSDSERSSDQAFDKNYAYDELAGRKGIFHVLFGDYINEVLDVDIEAVKSGGYNINSGGVSNTTATKQRQTKCHKQSWEEGDLKIVTDSRQISDRKLCH
ncbi:hypothetical protein Tco_0922306 [Tanacetum coccineum]|uniref:Uncharacterized protein n=1 Tax=Tanacetum coccineum TaxID=301880 RepID=A0ABQ5CZ87_9ASTR